MKYTEEILHRLYSNEDGYYYEIRPDAGGLDLVEVRLVESDGKESARMTFTDEVVDFLIRNLPKVKEDCIRARNHE